MESARIIHAAVEIGQQMGFITFDQLNALCKDNVESAKDIEAILAALSDKEIHVTND